MKLQRQTDHIAELDESERWDHTSTWAGYRPSGQITIEVEQIHIARSSPDDATTVWLIGRRIEAWEKAEPKFAQGGPVHLGAPHLIGERPQRAICGQQIATPIGKSPLLCRKPIEHEDIEHQDVSGATWTEAQVGKPDYALFIEARREVHGDSLTNCSADGMCPACVYVLDKLRAGVVQ